MGAALLILLLVFLFPCFTFFVASGFLLCVKPQGLRPPWCDWGMDKSDSAKFKKPQEISVVEIEKPVEVKTKIEAKAAPKPPRW